MLVSNFRLRHFLEQVMDVGAGRRWSYRPPVATRAPARRLHTLHLGVIVTMQDSQWRWQAHAHNASTSVYAVPLKVYTYVCIKGAIYIELFYIPL
jgi:hypothetical protein